VRPDSHHLLRLAHAALYALAEDLEEDGTAMLACISVMVRIALRQAPPALVEAFFRALERDLAAGDATVH